MSILKILHPLTKNPTRKQATRSSAHWARPRLEALETRMVLSDITGSPVANPITGTSSTSSQTGQ
jgi:hypothetical protein